MSNTTLPSTFGWSCDRPGRWSLTDGNAVRAAAHKTREGSLYCHDVMWMVYVNGEHITNASTLAEAKRDVAAHLSV